MPGMQGRREIRLCLSISPSLSPSLLQARYPAAPHASGRTPKGVRHGRISRRGITHSEGLHAFGHTTRGTRGFRRGFTLSDTPRGARGAFGGASRFRTHHAGLHAFRCLSDTERHGSERHRKARRGIALSRPHVMQRACGAGRARAASALPPPGAAATPQQHSQQHRNNTATLATTPQEHRNTRNNTATTRRNNTRPFSRPGLMRCAGSVGRACCGCGRACGMR